MNAKEIVIIIGINSFLGKSLATQLYASGMHIIGIYHQNTDNIADYVQRVHVSKLSEIADTNIKSIYLISAYIPYHKEDKALLKSVNEDLPKKVSQLFSNTKIIYASTVSVYGLPDEMPITEKTKTKPVNSYGESKLAGESYIMKHPAYAIVRISSIFGEGMKKHTFIPKIIETALQEKQITVFGDGSRKQNYIHVDDVAKYMILAASHAENGIFLAVSERSYSNMDVVQMIASETHAAIVHKGIDNSPSFIYDNKQTKSKLKYHKNSQFKKELTALIQCFKKQ